MPSSQQGLFPMPLLYSYPSVRIDIESTTCWEQHADQQPTPHFKLDTAKALTTQARVLLAIASWITILD